MALNGALNRRVAVEVMGWAYSQDSPDWSKWWCRSVPDGNGWWKRPGEEVWSCARCCDIPPNYSGSLEEAWEVHRVACRWLFSRRESYLESLTTVIREEIGHAVVWPHLLMFLKPHHICLAALRATENHALRGGR